MSNQQTLAEKYRDLGQPTVAIGLLRRAVVFMAEPSSHAQLDAAAQVRHGERSPRAARHPRHACPHLRPQARVALGDILAEMGAPTEQALAQYRAVLQHVDAAAPELSAAVRESLRASRRAAATAAAALLQAEGRVAESQELLGAAPDTAVVAL